MLSSAPLRLSASACRRLPRAFAAAAASAPPSPSPSPSRSPTSTRNHSTVTEPPPPSSSSATSTIAGTQAERNAAAFDSHYSYVHDPNIYRTLLRHRSPVVPHPISPRRTLNRGNPIPRPPYAETACVVPSLHPDRILLHSEESIERMENAARLARRTLDYACSLAEAGVTTDEIDRCVHQAILKGGAYPSPLNYAGFPKSVCSSVNEVICHGIPDARALQEGDVVSFDVSCFLGGVHGDNCATVIVGDVAVDEDGADGSTVDASKPKDYTKGEPSLLAPPDEINQDGMGYDWRGVRQQQKSTFQSDQHALSYITSRRLVRAARESLLAGIRACAAKPGGGGGACLASIGAAIHDVADAYGYGTVRKYRGHGIAEQFHMAPFVKHYRNSDKLELREGMIFTIEPMLTESAEADCEEWDDLWTVVSLSGGRSAQFEHTVLITEEGVRILTLP